MKRLVVLFVVAWVCSGCARMAAIIPPSREKPTAEVLADENSELNKKLDAEIQINHRLAYELEKARIENEKAQAALSTAGAQPAETVPAFQDFEVAKIDFGLLTGASDWDDKPGYDGMMIFLLPRDSEGDVIKRRGSCAFELVDVSRSNKVLMTWAVPSEILGEYWMSTPAGFRIKLPWQGDPPYGDNVVLNASFTDAYGRNFTASKLMKLVPQPPKPSS